MYFLNLIQTEPWLQLFGQTKTTDKVSTNLICVSTTGLKTIFLHLQLTILSTPVEKMISIPISLIEGFHSCPPIKCYLHLYYSPSNTWPNSASSALFTHSSPTCIYTQHRFTDVCESWAEAGRWPLMTDGKTSGWLCVKTSWIYIPWWAIFMVSNTCDAMNTFNTCSNQITGFVQAVFANYITVQRC